MPERSKRARGRPVGGSAFDRGDILDAAQKAISKGGYDALSMRGVAREIGASLATVQRHFATKEDLWRGAVDDFLDGFDPPGLSVARDGSMLVASIEQLLDQAGAHPGLIGSLIADRSAGHEERWAYLRDRMTGRHQQALETIETLQGEGLMRLVDVDALLMLMHVGVSSMASTPPSAKNVYGFDLEDASERRRLAEALANILQFGLAPR